MRCRSGLPLDVPTDRHPLALLTFKAELHAAFAGSHNGGAGQRLGGGPDRVQRLAAGETIPQPLAEVVRKEDQLALR
jgi:hypothetical protein